MTEGRKDEERKERGSNEERGKKEGGKTERRNVGELARKLRMEYTAKTRVGRKTLKELSHEMRITYN
jgi:hypothetical protein